MSGEAEKKPESAESEAEQREKKRTELEEYLQSPRKKRKNHVVMAYGAHLNPDLPTSIQNFLKRHFNTYALTYPRSPEELTRQFTRVIKLLIYDDEFTELDQGLNMLNVLKQKRNKGPVPILFLTSRPETLIQRYNKLLLPFHEADDYVNYVRAPVSLVLSRIRDGLANVNRRHSRRYKVNIGVNFESLTTGRKLNGRVLDLSMHGALLEAAVPDLLFRDDEQIKVHLPIGQILRQTHGDFLRLSCRVRRVLIAGNQAGVSFEYITDDQVIVLTKFLTSLVSVQVSRKARAMRMRSNR